MRILLVDDDAMLRRAMARLLRSLARQVIDFASPIAALRFAEREPETFDGAVLDVRMPEMDGRDLARHFLQLRPNLGVVLVTGDLTVAAAGRLLIEHRCVPVLQKPVDIKALEAVVREWHAAPAQGA
jgi:DNA-binding NtrC family response regulator